MFRPPTLCAAALMRICLACALLLTFLPARAVWADQALPISIEPSEKGLRVLVDGTLFTEYLTDSAGHPVLWPLVGPSGMRLTREWPIGERAAFESTDHPHQRGVWFGYGEMNGFDFWHKPSPKSSKRGRVVHRGFTTADSNGATATVVAKNDWVAPNGEVVCRDERTLRFTAHKHRRLIDFLIKLTPADQPLVIGDSKEGAFAIRVAGWLQADAKQGGRFVSSAGKTGKKAWGRPAKWVDYNGARGETRAGIAIFSHPLNFRPQPRWHVRGYGLFAANPFGEADFPRLAGQRQGPLTVRPGDELVLRYRVVAHLGNETQADIAALYRDYASQ